MKGEKGEKKGSVLAVAEEWWMLFEEPSGSCDIGRLISAYHTSGANPRARSAFCPL